MLTEPSFSAARHYRKAPSCLSIHFFLQRFLGPALARLLPVRAADIYTDEFSRFRLRKVHLRMDFPFGCKNEIPRFRIDDLPVVGRSEEIPDASADDVISTFIQLPCGGGPASWRRAA